MFLLLVCAIAFAQSQAQTQRDGLYWTQGMSGQIAAGSGSRLNVEIDGDVVLVGEKGGRNIRYAWIARTQAASSETATRQLSDCGIRVATNRQSAEGSVRIAVHAPTRGTCWNELRIIVPAKLGAAVINSAGGNVNATDFESDLTVNAKAGGIRIDRMSGDAKVKTGGGDVWIGRVGSAQCSSGGGRIRAESCARASSFETAGGDITVGEVRGSVNASTGGGNIDVAQCGGNVTATTRAGVIRIQNASGFVAAQSMAGRIEVSAAAGMRCHTGSGAIHARSMGGGPVQISTMLGNIVAELLPGTNLQDSILRAGSGDITVLLSSNIPVTLRANSEAARNGKGIVSEFPAIAVSSRTGTGRSFAQGGLNGGGALLRVLTEQGTIFIRRQP